MPSYDEIEDRRKMFRGHASMEESEANRKETRTKVAKEKAELSVVRESENSIAGELKIVRLDIRQRLNLEGLIRQQRPEDREITELLADIRKKIRVPEEEIGKYRRRNPVTREWMYDDDAVLKANISIEVTLSKAEARRLKTILKPPSFTPNVDDLDWLVPLEDQLKDLK